tara:strand:- start:35 stop:481 length:447 start_codon:yes stop_codon:yes gene_type:complete
VIRAMKEDDLPYLIKMGERFYNETPEYRKYKFDEIKLKQLGWICLTQPENICLVYDKGGIKGMMSGAVYEQFFSFDLTASELFLFVEKTARGALIGKKLIKAFELWANSMGAKETRVGVSSAITPDRTIGFYKVLGYCNTATILRKEL